MNREEKLATDYFIVDVVPHVWVKDPSLCGIRCPDAACLKLCPSRVFVPLETEQGPAIGVNYAVCLECGACLLFCPEDNIHFVYPRSGFGIVHRFG